MNAIKILGLLMLVISSSALTAQQASNAPVITLERTACFGTCPVYTVGIFEDGTVVYEGERSVAVPGEQISQIAPETVALMIGAFEDAGYFAWNEAYDTQTVSDLPSTITSVTSAGETHRIVRYAGDNTAPLALPFLEQWIDAMANTSLWTGIQPDVVNITNAMTSPVMTLQHGPNFGTGPVYSVAAYEDGTVVFTGIANVNEIGVHIVEVDASTVSSIAEIAQIMGYFGWQDSYEERLMTDHATISTSIRWDDAFKRIVRYDGDPNAPIGLVRIEDSISRLVADQVG